MTPDHRHRLHPHRVPLLIHKGRRPDPIEGRDPKQPVLVVPPETREGARGNGHRGVHRVGDDEEDGGGGGGCCGDGDKIHDDPGVHGEQVVAGHAGPARDPGADHHDVDPGGKEGGEGGVVGGGGEGALGVLEGDGGVEVGEVGGDPGDPGEVVEEEGAAVGELEFEEEGEGLADAAGGAEDGDAHLDGVEEVGRGEGEKRF